MGCDTCANKNSGIPNGCKSNGSCTSGGCNKLPVYDWLKGVPSIGTSQNQYAEIRFKNTRKDYYRNSNKYSLQTGDLVVVESDANYDIGTVSLSGELANLQFRKKTKKKDRLPLKILRKAKQEDIELWSIAKDREQETKTKARIIASEMGANMKISDVEFSGDNTRATFYYTADDRVDFRELIKKLAGLFKIKIDMKQIGARQEAGMLGGIGSCGRELCCSTWLTDFRSVSISALRYQQLSINSEKMAGQCGKLKCCLNFELDSYMEAIKDFPSPKLKLKTKKGTAFHFKSDILNKTLAYAYKDDKMINPIALTLEQVNKIIALNKKDVLPDSLNSMQEKRIEKEIGYQQVVGQDDLKRFDSEKKRRGKKKNKRKHKKAKKS
ncbi:MAG: cell fate regulator YaaT (PSP1 superfamily) [Patiriisocius sp.]|jgi:cell fate regulator YaaT (PSP1 superfamily)